jgi:hypothetical protein
LLDALLTQGASMFRFFLGVVVGMVAALMIERNRNAAGRPSMAGGGGGRVDELSTDAEHLPADPSTLSAGDGTPAQGPATGPGAVTWPPAESLDLRSEHAGQAVGDTSDSFNAA